MFTESNKNKAILRAVLGLGLLAAILLAGCGGGGPSVTDSGSDTIIHNPGGDSGNNPQQGGSGGYLFPFEPAIDYPAAETYRDLSSAGDDRLTRWLKNSYETLPAESSAAGVFQNASLRTWSDLILSGMNAERSKLGLPALTREPHLVASAQSQARDMALRNYFAHDTPDGITTWDRFSALHFPYYDHAGENAAKGQESAEEVVSGWLNSEKHRKNMLNADYRYAGVGVYFDSTDKTYPIHIIADFASFPRGLGSDWYQRGDVN